MLYTYSITQLADDNFEKRCEGIIEDVRSGCYLMPMFSMTLVPEGVPVWDKAGKMAKIYGRYRERLLLDGVESGILVQASLGHGYPITPNPFTKYVGFADGNEEPVCCPEDEEFIKHFRGVLRRLAEEHPKVIMLDDDFRLMMRGGRGCACYRHMELFRERTGENMNREELWEHVTKNGSSSPLARAFAKIQSDSLVKAARAFRDAIDEVDPDIWGINCTSGQICESSDLTNKIFAGKGKPTCIRIPNGTYAPISTRGFSDTMCQTAVCLSRLKRRGIDIILGETDTIPFNRYGKSAAYLHAHFASAVLDGVKGAKHWLSRTSAYEPSSGKAYRRILSHHRGMYERLSELSGKIKWSGCASVFTETLDFDFTAKEIWRNGKACFITKNIERLGLPFFFTDGDGEAYFLEGDIVDNLTDERIRELFDASVFCDGRSARLLTERGFGELLGVTAHEWDLGTVNGETFDGTLNKYCTAQKKPYKLIPTNSKTEILSYNFRRSDGGAKLLAPAVTVKERDGGRLSVVFCGTPNAEFNYMEGFSFLNETRKGQLAELLVRAKALRVYYKGDCEVLLRAGELSSGGTLVFALNLGYDAEREPIFYTGNAPKAVKRMKNNGEWEKVEFECCGDTLKVITELLPMTPEILLIES